MNMEAVAIEKKMYAQVADCQLVDGTSGIVVHVALYTGGLAGENRVTVTMEGNEYWSARKESMRAMVPVEVLLADGLYASEELAKASWDAAVAQLYVMAVKNL